jgi:hypothetical protein
MTSKNKPPPNRGEGAQHSFGGQPKTISEDTNLNLSLQDPRSLRCRNGRFLKWRHGMTPRNLCGTLEALCRNLGQRAAIYPSVRDDCCWLKAAVSGGCQIRPLLSGSATFPVWFRKWRSLVLVHLHPFPRQPLRLGSVLLIK